MNGSEQGVGGGLKGRLERRFSCWAQEGRFLHPKWHPCPPSPAGPVSVPCSTEPQTGTACKSRIMLKHITLQHKCAKASVRTQSTHFSISGAQCTKSWLQNLKAGFFISSMKVMSSPQGCGLFTINRSSSTLCQNMPEDT